MPLRQNIDASCAWYFAGLFDGEGSLSVQRNRRTGGITPSANIVMRYDQKPLLREVCDMLGIGAISSRDVQARWAVQSRSELRELLVWMQAFPGRTNKYTEQLPIMLDVIDTLDGYKTIDLNEAITALAALKEPTDRVLRQETLVCAHGHSWVREFRRGRKPQLCDTHAAAPLVPRAAARLLRK